MNQQHDKLEDLVAVINNLLFGFAEVFGLEIIKRILEEIKMRNRPALVPIPACSTCKGALRRLRRQ